MEFTIKYFSPASYQDSILSTLNTLNLCSSLTWQTKFYTHTKQHLK
jgi:hypothetical protein